MRLIKLSALLFIATLITACGSQAPMDADGLRDRANQETGQVR